MQEKFTYRKCLRIGLKSLVKNWLVLLKFILLMIFFQLCILFIYLMLENILNHELSFMLLVLILIQQTYFILRIQLKQLIYLGIYNRVKQEKY